MIEDVGPTNAEFCCGVPRDSHWHTAEKHYLPGKLCIVCGGAADTVHHVIPVSVDKSLEMVESNWRPICNRNNCHGLIAHNGCRYHTYNAHLDADASRIHGRIAAAASGVQAT